MLGFLNPRKRGRDEVDDDEPEIQQFTRDHKVNKPLSAC